jgi:hypothetical protein
MDAMRALALASEIGLASVTSAQAALIAPSLLTSFV